MTTNAQRDRQLRRLPLCTDDRRCRCGACTRKGSALAAIAWWLAFAILFGIAVLSWGVAFGLITR